MSKPRITLRPLKTPADWQAARPLVQSHNKHITPKKFTELLTQMLPLGYQCLGAFEGDTLVGIMGYWVGVRFWCQKYMDLDNVIVAESHRSRGIGKKMLDWAEKEARKQGCTMLGLDSYTTAYAAHRFYFREGYKALGYHFTKDL